MADLRYVVDIDTTGAEREINSLKNTILGAGAVVAGAFAVDKLVDFARSSIDTTARIQDLRGAFTSLTGSLEESNREFERVRQLSKDLGTDSMALAETYAMLAGTGLDPTNRLLTAFVDMSKNATDQLGALEAAAKLFSRTTSGGLGLEELDVLAEKTIPVYEMLSEELGIARNEVSEYGKTAKGAAEIQAALVRQMEKRYAGTAVRELGSINSQLFVLKTATEEAQEAFGEGLVEALNAASGGVVQFVEDNKELIRTLGELTGDVLVFLLDHLKEIGMILGLLFGSAVIRAVGTFVGALRAIIPVITAIRTGLAAMAALALATPAGWIALAGAIAAAGISMFAFGDDTEEAAERTETLQNNLDGVGDTAEDLQTVMQNVSEQTQGASQSAGEFHVGLLGTRKEGENLESTLTVSEETLEKMKKTLQDISVKIKEQNADSLIALEYEGKRLQKELELLKVGQAATDAALAVLDVEEDRANALQDIENKYQALLATGANEEEIARLKRKEVEEVNTLYDEQVRKVREIAKKNGETREEIERQNEALQDLAKTNADIVDYMADLKKGTAEARREIERMNMTAFERELDDIDRRLEEGLQDQIAEINSPDNAIDPIVKQEKIRELIEATEEAKRVQKEAAREAYEYSRSFEYGWKKAYEEYADDATNAAKTAEEIFNTSVQGMEDALVGFIRTGKFEWKDFVDELVELLLRSELKRLIADIFGGITGAGGGGGGGGSILGGIAKGIGAIFGGGGSSSPPGATPGFGGGTSSGGGSSSGSVLGNLWSGVKKLFGFENGGSLPAGQFGIVGEAGPELITGPATITPMGKLGGTTNVTYNISAVDAASFRSLVARDPEFIHAVAMKGGSSVPMRR